MSRLVEERVTGMAFKCRCNDVEIGSLANEVLLKIPENDHIMSGYMSRRVADGLSGKGVSVDACLVDEIEFLWSNRVETHGCCCGHGLGEPMINVKEDHIPRMLALGYQPCEGPPGTFSPKGGPHD